MRNDLLFKPLAEEHVCQLSKLWSDIDVIRYTNIKTPCTYSESFKRSKRYIESQKGLSINTIFTLYYENRICGIVGCLPIDREKFEFGLFYQVAKSEWGHGVGFDCASWIFQYMNQSYIRIKIYADVVEDNVASVKILKKLGFTYLNREIGAFKRNDISMNVENYIYIK